MSGIDDRETDVDPLEIGIEGAGAEEVVAIPWSLALQRRAEGRLERSPRRAWIILATALLGMFGSGFSLTVLTVSLGDIAADLGTTKSVLTWAITGPVLVMAVLGPIAGKLADRHGARRVYLISISGVAVMSFFTIFAWSGASIIGTRVLGAALGAGVSPAALAMINRTFPPQRRALALGYWSLVGAGAPVIGVVIGGPLVEAFGWRWIFILQTPIIFGAVLIGFLFLPRTERGARVPFDVAGSVTLAFGVGLLLVAMNRGPSLGWASGWVLGTVLVAVVLLVAFVRAEGRTDHPLLPLVYFRRRNFTFPMVNQFFSNFAYMGGFILTPLLMTEVLGYSTTQAGLASIARPIAFSIMGPVAGWFVLRLGERTMGSFGAVMLIASMLLLAMVTATSGQWFIEVALVLSGLGMGATAPAMIAALAASVDRADLGVAGAASQTMSQIGVVVGMQLLLTIQDATEDRLGVGSYALAYRVGAVAAVVALLTALMVRRTSHAPVDDGDLAVES